MEERPGDAAGEAGRDILILFLCLVSYLTSLLMRDGSALGVLPKSSSRTSKTKAQTKHAMYQGNDAVYQPCGKAPASILPKNVMVLPRGCESTFRFSFVINHRLSAYRQQDSLHWFVKDNLSIHLGRNLKVYWLLGFYTLAKIPLPLTKIDFLIDQLSFLVLFLFFSFYSLIHSIWKFPS